MLRRTLGTRFLLAGALGILAAALGGACSATPPGSSSQFGVGGSGSAGSHSAGVGAGKATGSGSNTNSGGPGGGIGFNDGGTGGGVPTDGPTCAAVSSKGQQAPLDMYIMLDQSGSMSDMVQGGGTKWDAVTSAIKAFVQTPNLTGISVGIQYFALPANGMMANCNCPNGTCPMPGDICIGGQCLLCLASAGGGDSCNAADYVKPEVEIAPLPGVAGNIVSSMSAHMPQTGTPTFAALSGAVEHGQAWAKTHPGHVVVALLATNGVPQECDTSTPNIAAIAAGGLAGNPSVKTFTIGIFAPADIPGGPDLLNAISAAGGSGKSFTIDTMNQNVQMQFIAALNAIRGTALGCQYTIPPSTSDGGAIDFNQVNVQFTPTGGMPEVLGKVDGAGTCPASGDGWYYDNNAAPTQIILCPNTCAKVKADAMGGEVDILLGCKTHIGMNM